MIPVQQRDLSPDNGDCFAACIASILELDLDALPNPHGDNWQAEWREWLRPRGLSLLTWVAPEESGEWDEEQRRAFLPGYCVGAVDSARFPGKLHAVVICDGKVVHDPHPDGFQGDYVVKEIDCLMPMDPKQVTNTACAIDVTITQRSNSEYHAAIDGDGNRYGCGCSPLEAAGAALLDEGFLHLSWTLEEPPRAPLTPQQMDALMDLVQLRKMEIQAGEYNMWLQADWFPLIAVQLVQLFKIEGGTNFVSWGPMKDPDSLDSYELVLQRCNGKTVAELLGEAKETIARLEAELRKEQSPD